MTGWRRGALAGVLCLGLVVDGWAWSAAFARGEFEASLLLLYPERVVGREMLLSLVDVQAIEADRYRVGEGQWSGVVVGDPQGLEVGDEIYVRGTFVERGLMQESWRVVAPQRGDKKLLGLLAMGLVGVLVLGGVRLERDGAVLRG